MSESYKSFKEAYEALYGPVKEEKQKPKAKPVIFTKTSSSAPKRRGRRNTVLPDNSIALKKSDPRAVTTPDETLVKELPQTPNRAVSSRDDKTKINDNKHPVEYSKTNQSSTVVKSNDLQGIIHKSNKDDLKNVLSTHKFLMDAFYELTGLEKRSLAAKYLHFHCPDKVFIYDSIAREEIRRFVKRPDKSMLEGCNEKDQEYADFVCRLIELQQELSEKDGVYYTPRTMDGFLLRRTI